MVTVREHHSLLKTTVVGSMTNPDAARALVNVQVRPDAVTGTVTVIQADHPKVLASERIQCVALHIAKIIASTFTVRTISIMASSLDLQLMISRWI